jgi:hypothetical protein
MGKKSGMGSLVGDSKGGLVEQKKPHRRGKPAMDASFLGGLSAMGAKPKRKRKFK